MGELRFDGRVAVITGAGRGLGRSYALLLAARGAKVVVNDPGVAMAGGDTDEAPADAVVAEIVAAGGEAIADTHSVATAAGGAAIVDAATAAWGRIDILVHNAGIVRNRPIAEMTTDDFDAVIDVHLRGGFHVLQPAFRAMIAAGYGRIVMTGSVSGLYGSPNVAGYCASKTGLMGMTYNAAIEGQAHGIAANMILPAAVTRMAAGRDTSAYPPMEPDLVAPAVAWLAHETCTMSGELMLAGAGRINTAFTTETVGRYRPAWTIEEVAADMAAIDDRGETVTFPVLPSGQSAHLAYSFEMARRG